MTTGVYFLLTVVAGALLVPISVFAIQIVSAVALRPRRIELVNARTNIAVVVPAHNEEAVIAGTVAGLLQNLSPDGRLLVVADNCVDATANAARQAGAEVLERNDPSRRGKGFALAAGLRRLESDPPDVVVFVDADCQFRKGRPSDLARAALVFDAPVQCLNLMVAGADASRLAEFAWAIKNDLRPEGFARLGLPCQLTGTGMAIPWSRIDPCRFATAHVTEDVLIGVDCALRGRAPRFFREVNIVSVFPESAGGRSDQKRRWLHGHLALIAERVPALVARGLLTGNTELLALAADLVVPPLTLLASVVGAVFVATSVDALVRHTYAPFALASLGACVFGSAIVIAWAARGRALIGVAECLELPRHLFQVVLHSGRFLIGKRSVWVRAERRPEAKESV